MSQYCKENDFRFERHVLGVNVAWTSLRGGTLEKVVVTDPEQG